MSSFGSLSTTTHHYWQHFRWLGFIVLFIEHIITHVLYKGHHGRGNQYFPGQPENIFHINNVFVPQWNGQWTISNSKNPVFWHSTDKGFKQGRFAKVTRWLSLSGQDFRTRAWCSTHHCSFCYRTKAVDKYVAGNINWWTCRVRDRQHIVQKSAKVPEELTIVVSATEPKLLMKILHVTFMGGPVKRNDSDMKGKSL